MIGYSRAKGKLHCEDRPSALSMQCLEMRCAAHHDVPDHLSESRNPISVWSQVGRHAM